MCALSTESVTHPRSSVESGGAGRSVAAVRTALLTTLLGLVLAVGAPAAGAAWRLPVDGAIVGRFHVGADPFAAGQRRGVDLAAAPGARVVAPCAGTVAFAGSVPGFGGAVSLRCGALTATVLGLGRVSAHVGTAVLRGAPVGVVGARGRVRLGARVSAQRFGYRDPLALVGADRSGPPPLVGPRGPGRRRGAPPPVATLAPPRERPSARSVRSGAPTLAWLGLALIACALPGGVVAWRVRRARAPLARARLSRPR